MLKVDQEVSWQGKDNLTDSVNKKDFEDLCTSLQSFLDNQASVGGNSMPTESMETPPCKSTDEVGLIGKESKTLPSKAVTMIKVPEVILCFNDGACQVVKDICIGEDLHTLDDILLQNNVVSEKLSSVLKAYVRHANDDPGGKMDNGDVIINDDLKSISSLQNICVDHNSWGSSEAGEITSTVDIDMSSIPEKKVTLEELLSIAATDSGPNHSGQEKSEKVSQEEPSLHTATWMTFNCDSGCANNIPSKDDVQIEASPSFDATRPTQASGREESPVNLQGDYCSIKPLLQSDVVDASLSSCIYENDVINKMDSGVDDTNSTDEVQMGKSLSFDAIESCQATRNEESPVNVKGDDCSMNTLLQSDVVVVAQSSSIHENVVIDKMDIGVNDTDSKDEIQMGALLSLDAIESSQATQNEERHVSLKGEDHSMNTLKQSDVVAVVQSSSIHENHVIYKMDNGINDTNSKDEVQMGTLLSFDAIESSKATQREESPVSQKGEDCSINTLPQSDVVVAVQSSSIHENHVNDKKDSGIKDTHSEDEVQMGTSLPFDAIESSKATRSEESPVNLKGEDCSINTLLQADVVVATQSSNLHENKVINKLDSGDNDTNSKGVIQRRKSPSFDATDSSHTNGTEDSPVNNLGEDNTINTLLQSDSLSSEQSSSIHENDFINKVDSGVSDTNSKDDEVQKGTSLSFDAKECSHTTGEEESHVDLGEGCSTNTLPQTDTLVSGKSNSNDDNDADTKMDSEVNNTDSKSGTRTSLSSEENQNVKDTESLLNDQNHVVAEEAVPDSTVASIGGSFHQDNQEELNLPGPSCLSAAKVSSGHIAFSGSISLRSDSSTTSTRSFAFPVLQSEWNTSPVKMAKADRRYSRKKRCWGVQLLCCKF